MTQRLETRAARLVTALEKAGHKVSRVTVKESEVLIDLGTPVDPGQAALDNWIASQQRKPEPWK